MSHDIESRYARNISVNEIGIEGQKLIINSKIAVIGAGGLGSALLLYLVATGINNIVIIDHDKVELHNLQRQIIHNYHDIGSNKTFSAWQKLHDINNQANITCFEEKIDNNNINKLPINDCDLIIDCSDNFITRSIVNKYCADNNIIFLTGAVSKFQGQLYAFQANKENCCYQCLYSDAIDIDNNCNDGILGPVVGIIGTIMANEVIKIITGWKNNLIGKMIIFDMKDNNLRTVNINKDKNCQNHKL